MCFPILVQAQAQIERRLAFQPRNVRRSLCSLRIEILPVKVNSVRVLPTIMQEPIRVQARANPIAETDRPAIFLQQLEYSQRARRFVPMNSRRNIEARCLVGLGSNKRGAASKR